MKLIFDLRRVGLGNNGGSSTIINSANTLVELGNEVYIVDNIKNYHTWTPLKAEHIIFKNNEKIPDADFIIATGYNSVSSTINSPSKCGIKLHWIRGWETWRMNEGEIVKKVLGAPTIKLVNGVGLQEKLQSLNCPSYLVRPGYDLDIYKPLNIRQNNKKVIIGGLYNENRNGQVKRTDWLFNTYYSIKNERGDVYLWLFGTHNKPSGKLIDVYLKQPTPEEKNKFYNYVNIWLAPTALEGLHMPPAEAMLTECPVIGTNSKMNGMRDYLSHMKTGIVSSDNKQEFIKSVNILINNQKLRNKLGKSAREKILNIGSRRDNMIKFIELLKRLKK